MSSKFLSRAIERAKNDRFLRNSFIFFVGSFLASFGNYFFHFLMVRLLSVSSYGEVQALLALSNIFSIPAAVLGTVVIKYAAHFQAQGDFSKIHSLFILFVRRALVVIACFFGLFLILIFPLADFLRLSSKIPLVILALILSFSFLAVVNRGIIQGLKNFRVLSGLYLLEAFFKIMIGFLLLKMSFGVNGVMGAFVLSGLIGYLVSFLPLKQIFRQAKTVIEAREIFRYFLPTFFTLLFLTLFYNIDLVLAKHFLAPQQAGEYGALALLGHIIFFLPGPFVAVMFPYSAEAFAKNSNTGRILAKTLILTSSLAGAVLMVYFLFPGLVIKILLGGKFLGLNKILGWFGLSMFFYSLIILLSQYFLAVHKKGFYWLLATGIVLQTVSIAVWHANLQQLILAMNFSLFATLLLLIFYYFKTRKTIKR